MGETVVKAKNTFGEGLIIDFAPDNTLNTILTNALNATLITYNGNELSLLNDMGNGRVETAFLPEGYVPVGSCEFGGIIYIVSYNPLDNKSQIGCFPSPERNIANDELNSFASLSGSELIDEDGNIKQYSIKKIISSTEVNPGDKFIINSSDLDKDWATLISNFNNTKYKNGIEWPKLVKISLVAIEDSGKINYLDSELQWHDRTYNVTTSSSVTSSYWINSNSVTNPSGNIDIDTYREAIGANYSVFQSKVSGKLAILVELEKIETYSCAIKILKSGNVYSESNKSYQNFDIYTTSSWTASSNEINPSGFILSNITNSSTVTLVDSSYTDEPVFNALKGYTIESEEEDEEEEEEILHYVPYDLLHTLGSSTDITILNFIENSYETLSPAYYRDNLIELKLSNNKLSFKNNHLEYKLDNGSTIGIPDDVINNYNNKLVMKYIGTVKVPIVDSEYLGSLSFTVTPCMPYGLLNDLSTNHTINFRDYGNNNATLHTWKYKQVDSLIELTWGFKALMDENTNISKILFKFRDCLGLCAIKEISGLESYNGVFTSYLPLDNPTGYSNKNEDGSIILHISNVPDTITPNSSENFLLYATNRITGKFKYTAYSDTPEILQMPWSSYKAGMIDSGQIYSNYLYLVEIVVKRESTTTETLLDIVYYRWLWTNGLYNLYYTTALNSNYADFEKLPLNMLFDLKAGFDGSKLKSYYETEYLNLLEEVTPNNNYKTLGSNTHYLGYTKDDDSIEKDTNSYVRLLSEIKLRDGHNCLINQTYLENIKAKIAIADSEINVPSEYTYQASEDLSLPIPALQPVISSTHTTPDSKFISLTELDYLQYKDSYKVDFYDTVTAESEKFLYYKTDNLLYSIQTAPLITNMKILSSNTEGVKLSLTGVKYNKILAYSASLYLVPIFESLIANPKNLELYNLTFNSSNDLDCARYLCIGYGFYQLETLYYESFFSGVYNSASRAITLKEMHAYYSISSKDYDYPYKSFSLDSIANNAGINDLFVPIVLSLAAMFNLGDNGINISINTLDHYHIHSIYHGYNVYSYYNSLYEYNTYSDDRQCLIDDRDANENNNKSQIKQLTPLGWVGYPSTTMSFKGWLPTVLGIRVNNKLYSTLNFFRQSLGTDDKLANFTEFRYNSPTPKNYGLLIGSLLGQLYYQTNNYQPYYSYNNIINLDKFTETFKTNIIIQTSIDKSSSPTVPWPSTLSTGHKECCLILLPNKMSLEDYYNTFLSNNSINGIDLTNIKPLIENETKTIELIYEDPYIIDQIMNKYTTPVKAIVRDFTNENDELEVFAEPDSNTLYTLEGEELVKLNQNATFKLLDITKTSNNASGRPGYTISSTVTESQLLVNSEILTNLIYSDGTLKFNNALPGTGIGLPITWDYYDNRNNANSNRRRHLDIDGFSTINIFPYTQIG